MTRVSFDVLLLFPAFLAGCSASGPSSRLWEETGGPYAQNISAILPDNRIAGTLYASPGGGEIAVSTSDGRTWGHATPVPGGPEVQQLVQDPDNPDRLFAATDSGAFVSPDRARSWAPLHVGPAGTPVRVLAIDPWSPSVIYAGTGGKGLYRSSDGGKTWNDINASQDLLLSRADVYDIGIDLSKPDLVFAAVSPFGIVCTTDGGADWRGLTPEFSGTGAHATRLLIRKDGHGTILYGTTSGSIMKTTNGGESWSPSRTAKDLDGILSLSVFPGRPDEVIAGTERGIIISSDFGTRWGVTGGDLPGIPTRVTVAGAGSHMIVFAYGSGMGLRASDDNGVTWRKADLKLGGSTVSMLACNPSGDRLFAATGNVCVTYTTGPSGAWSDAGPGITGGPIRSLSIDPSVPGVVYATTAGGVFVSTDNGGTWQSTPRSMQISPYLYQAHPSIKTRVFMTCDQGVFVSTDRGQTWNQSRPLGNRWVVHSLTFSPSNAGTIIGATYNSGVIISYDGGFTWEQARYGIPGNRVESVALDDSDPDTFYAYLPDGECYRSLNKGLEWNRYMPPWKQSDNVRISCDPHLQNSVVALVDGRQVYYSPSGGGTWFRLAEADLHANAVSLCWNAATMTLYAAGRDRGVYSLPLGKRIREILGE
jgi:photosystem II stability/assembly factor-like uncharacterized protein